MRASGVLVLALALVTSPYALAQSKYAYLTETTNEIYSIDRGSMNLTPEEFAKVATRACKTLERLLRDNDFMKDLDQLTKASSQHTEYHRQLTQDLGLFLDSFISQERVLLNRADISDEASRQILLAASSLRNSLTGKPDPKKIIGDIDRLRREICGAASSLLKAEDDAKAREQRWKTLRRWGLGLGGLTLIGVDAAALPASGGLATASFTLGGAAVGAAVAQ